METARSNEQLLPRQGDVVAGKYRIDSIIGAGGMGVVMGALDTSLGRAVAIKFLSPNKARREGAVQRFLREARAAASIQSEHVCRVFEVGTLSADAPFIVMEYLRGSDLARMLATRGPLGIDEAVDYLLSACEALAEAHAHGIVHRDLKPQNLFVAQRPDGSPCLKVLDFGISKAQDEEAPNLTSTETVMGTPLYMSPEQVRSLKNVDHRSDIWALGSILFEILTASPIYQAPSASALCAMIAMDPPTPLRARRPDAPPELEAVILRCLHKDPAGRFADVAALAEALGPFASERGRASSMRISRVLRGSAATALATMGSAPSPAGIGMGTTVDSGSNRHLSHPPQALQAPSGYPAGPTPGPSNFPIGVGASHHPTLGYRTTQQTWQETGDGSDKKRGGSSPVLVAFLGIMTGLLVLALIGGVGWFVYTKRVDGQLAQAGADAGAVGPGAGAPGAAPASAASPSSTSSAQASASGAAPSAPAVPKRADAKDAGAPALPTTPDAGAPPAHDDLDARKRTAQGRCSHLQFLLSQNDPKTNANAKMVKQQDCLQSQSLSPNSGAANCDRAVCRQACSMLQDKDCIRQLDYAERNNPLPF